ncbi:MAG: putative manganese-dependent inorganic diphosphatase [Spirochaetales bacterium]|nr:putative manganese-dependent inorganic diphosphatase [Spirochaetales bacterium]
MSVVYVTGHRNPDMDSICSAYAYAYLKNLIDQNNQYVPVRLGSANKNVKALFSRLGIELPTVLKDVKPRVREVIKTPRFTVRETDPLYSVIDIFTKHRPTVLPVFDDNDNYVNLLTSDDINAFFLRENNGSRLVYSITEENIEKVIPGKFIKKAGKTVDAPVMVGAMEFDQFEKRLTAISQKPVLVTGLRDRVIRRALKEGIPGLVITGLSDPEDLFGFNFADFNGFIYLSELDTAATIRYLRLSNTVKTILNSDRASQSIQADMLFDDAKDLLINSDERGYSVFDGDKWIGFVTRRCFLNKPKQKLILVDHNETDQSVLGIEDAEIVEIIDHHRLAPPRMRNPIYICSEPLGSTCTIVYEQFKKYGLKPDPKRAEVLLSGLFADTVMLKSPTATSYDRHVAEKLAQRAGVEDMHKFAQDLFSSASSLAEQDPMKVVEADLKKYFEAGCRFAIGQVEVTNLVEIDSLKEKYIAAVGKERVISNLDWCMLLVTDVINDESVLITTGHDKESRFYWEKKGDNYYSLPGILSRKKQLLPEVLRILED